MDVIELDNNPPVQDSAKDTVSFFLVSNFTIFKDKQYRFTQLIQLSLIISISNRAEKTNSFVDNFFWVYSS